MEHLYIVLENTFQKLHSKHHELRLTPSQGWLEFQRLNTSCRWLRPTVDSSSGSHLDVQKYLLVVASWNFIHKEFIPNQPLNSFFKTWEKSSPNISERIYFLTYIFDFIRIRGSHQDFAEHLAIVAANAIFHDEKQLLRGILKTLFLKTTPVNYRNRWMINNRWVKH